MQFYIISIAFFHVFIVNNRGKCPRGWGFSSFLYARGGGFELFFAQGWGIRPPKKLPGGGGGSFKTEAAEAVLWLVKRVYIPF